MKIIRPTAITDAVLVSTNVPEADHPAWSGAATYVKGAKVILASTHKRYESLIDGNQGKDPSAAEPGIWTDLGATNRWKLFDASVGSQTAQLGSIDMELRPLGRVNALAVLNVNAASIRVIVTDPVEGVVYDRTFSLIASSGVRDMYAFYFEPIRRRRDFVLFGLPPYYGATIRVVMTAPSGAVSCGWMVLGQSKQIGGTRWGLSLGISDFTKKDKNQFGEYIVVERDWAKRGRFPLRLAASEVDDVIETLVPFRAKPIVYVGAEQFGSSVIGGFFKDLDVVIPGPTYCDCSVEIEGLT